MATIEPYQTKAGRRYVVRYRDPDRKQRKKSGFKTKAEAQEWANTIEVTKLQGSYINPTFGRATISEIGKEWENSLISSSESWKNRQLSIWEVHVKPYWGSRRVGQIKTSQVQDWIAELADENRDPRPLMPKTIRHILGVLAAVLDRAVHDQRIANNPARGNIKLPRKLVEDRPFLTSKQVHALLEEVPEQYKTITWLLVTAGMRWGELAALRPQDLLGDNRIRLARAYSRTNGKSVLTDLKGHELRTVVVPSTVYDLVVKAAEGKPRSALIWEAPRKGGALVPPKPGHWLSAAVTRCAEKDESFPEHLPAHSLRHTAASLMISSGANIKTIQRQLGHKSASMTLDQYGHLMEDDLDSVSRAVESLLFP